MCYRIGTSLFAVSFCCRVLPRFTAAPYYKESQAPYSYSVPWALPTYSPFWISTMTRSSREIKCGTRSRTPFESTHCRLLSDLPSLAPPASSETWYAACDQKWMNQARLRRGSHRMVVRSDRRHLRYTSPPSPALPPPSSLPTPGCKTHPCR